MKRLVLVQSRRQWSRSYRPPTSLYFRTSVRTTKSCVGARARLSTRVPAVQSAQRAYPSAVHRRNTLHSKALQVYVRVFPRIRKGTLQGTDVAPRPAR
jgi:hypothetical protein